MLELLAKQHDDWIRVAYNMTNDTDEAKDLVQEMYLVVLEGKRTIKDITYKDQINRYFIWKLLRSLFIDKYRREQSKKHIKTTPMVEDIDESVLYEYDTCGDDAFSSIMNKVNVTTEGWSPYDKQLFNLYYIQGQSLRHISRGANIGLSAIHNGVKNIREELRNSLSEDLIDYFNGDYDKI